MKKYIKAFSLIEVVIATWIISITVFWVYKLIWENTKIISNSWNYLQINSLFPVLEECIENLWISSDTSIYLWNNLDSCIKSSSWTIIDNITYNLSANITNSWTNYIDWELVIDSEQNKTQTWFYKQIK